LKISNQAKGAIDMRTLTSGVYYVDYKNIQTFIENANESGWDWGDDVDVYEELAQYATTKSIKNL
jgi:hypothetical protein